MKLSLKLIAQEIQTGDVEVIRTRFGDPDALRFDHFLLWNKTDNPDPSALYVVNSATIKPDTLFPSGIALIILGKCETHHLLNCDADIMLWSVNRREMSYMDQINALSVIFRHYQQIDHQLSEHLISNGTLQDLITLCESVFHNMILILDSGFSILFESRKSNPLDWDQIGFPSVPTLPAETVEQIRVNGQYRNRMRNQGTFLITNEVLNCNTLFIQIQKEQMVFYIALLETSTPITPAHRQLLVILGEYIFQSLKNRRFSNTKTVQFEYFLSKMLMNEKVEASELNRQLQNHHWKANDHYICFTLDLNLWNNNDVHPYSISKIVEDRLEGTFSFYHDERIICLTNLDQANLSRAEFLQILALFVRDRLFQVGVSFEFEDFSTLVHYYNQTLAAIKFGKQKNPDEWIYRFEKYALDYFMKYGTSMMDARHLCNPDLILLYRYDKEFNTDLLHTLDVYLSRGLNATETAAELFIHRNTLYQRLSKIESLIQSKLSSPANRLYMQLSYSFMDFESMNKD